MKCRRCGKDLPFGQKKTCPHCGIFLDTFIDPRSSNPDDRARYKPNRRATVMTFVSIGFVVALVCIVVPVMRNIQKHDMLMSMEEMFEKWNGKEDEFSEGDWEKNLAVFSAAVDNFRLSFPDDEEDITRIARYLDILCGIDPDTGELSDPDKAQREYNEQLILHARDEIFDITGVSLAEPDSTGRCTLIVQVKNTSKKFISGVTMEFRIFDANGNPSNGSPRGGNDWYPRIGELRPGEEKSFSFRELWNDAGAAGAKIEEFVIEYPDIDKVFFPPDVCKALWP